MTLFKLQGPTEPFKLELIDGLSMTVKPRSDFALRVAQAYAREKLEELERSAEICMDAGLLPSGIMADLGDAQHRASLFEIFMVQKMAEMVILSWEGFFDQHDQPVPVTPELIRAAMSVWPRGWKQSVGDLFWFRYMSGHGEIVAAKKDSATSASGISSPAAVANIAADASKTDSPAPTDKPD